jgi:hypothetical protein
MVALPSIGTKSKAIIQFIADSDGARYGEIVRFICEQNGLDYDEKVERMVRPLYGYKPVKKMVRRYAGYYGTNLTDRRYGLLTRFCMKDPDGKWRVKPYIKKQMAEDVIKNGFALANAAVAKSSLEASFKSDEIPNNSKVIERTILCAPSFISETGLNPMVDPSPAIAQLKIEADAIKALKDARAAAAKAAEDFKIAAVIKKTADQKVTEAENAVRKVLGL